MMSFKDKIKRIEEARNSDELPLVAVLNNIPGARAWIDPFTSAKDNQEGGDVKLQMKDQPYVHSFEMQVSKKYQNFSYGKAKVIRFIGQDGGPCWVVLGCVDEDGKSMFFCMVGSVTLNELVKSDNPHVRLADNKYYVIRPEAFIGIKKKWIGNTLDEVIRDWWMELTSQAT